MKSIITLSFFILNSINIIHAQTYHAAVGGELEEKFGGISKTNDNGYILTGLTRSFGGLLVFGAKLDPDLNPEWSKGYYSTTTTFYGQGAINTSDNGYLLTGYSYNGTTGRDLVVVKTNSLGDTLWTKTVHSGTGDEYAVKAVETYDEKYAICGTVYNVSSPSREVFLMKLDTNGSVIFTKAFGTSGYEIIRDFEETSDNGFIICGYQSGGSVLIKTDNTGAVQWAKSYSGSGSNYFYRVKQTSDGGYMVVGSSKSFGNGNNCFFAVKTNSIGDTLWTSAFGGSLYDYAYDVVEREDGGFFVAGYSRSYGHGDRKSVV